METIPKPEKLWQIIFIRSFWPAWVNQLRNNVLDSSNLYKCYYDICFCHFTLGDTNKLEKKVSLKRPFCKLVEIITTALNVSKYGVFSGPKTRKYGPEKTPYFDTFHAVYQASSRKMDDS